jgi:hypothetical protein
MIIGNSGQRIDALGVIAFVAILLWRMPAGPPSLPVARPALALTLAWLMVSPQQRHWYDAMLFALPAMDASHQAGLDCAVPRIHRCRRGTSRRRLSPLAAPSMALQDQRSPAHRADSSWSDDPLVQGARLRADLTTGRRR